MLPQPDRAEIRKVLDRNYRSKKELAKRAKVVPASVSTWLRGGTSANIEAKAVVLYHELREKEKSLAAA